MARLQSSAEGRRLTEWEGGCRKSDSQYCTHSARHAAAVSRCSHPDSVITRGRISAWSVLEKPPGSRNRTREPLWMQCRATACGGAGAGRVLVSRRRSSNTEDGSKRRVF
jgi:hypothetical protein